MEAAVSNVIKMISYDTQTSKSVINQTGTVKTPKALKT